MNMLNSTGIGKRIDETCRLFNDIVDELTRSDDYEPHSPEFYQSVMYALEDGAFLRQWFDGKGYTDAEATDITERAHDMAHDYWQVAPISDVDLCRAYDQCHSKPFDSLGTQSACEDLHHYRLGASAAYNELYSSGKYKIQTPSERSTLKRERDKTALADREYSKMTDRGLGDALAKQYVTLIQSSDDEARGIAEELRSGIEAELQRRIRNAGVDRHYRPRSMPA